MNDIKLLEIAKEYAEHNMVVVPAFDKRPFGQNWQIESAENILKNTKNWAKANGLNIVLGKTSGVTVVDIDLIEKNNPTLFKTVMELLPPPGEVQRIGNPKKRPSRFFQYNGERARKLNAIQVEILSDGNNCCLPPGWNHVSKTNFKWVGVSLIEAGVDSLPILTEETLTALHNLNEKIKDEEKKAKGNSHKVDTTLESGRCRSGSHNKLSAYTVARRFDGYSKQQLIIDVLKFDKQINADADFLYFNCKSRKWKHGNSADNNAASFVDEIWKRNIPKDDATEKMEQFPTMKDGFYIEIKPKDKSGNVIEGKSKWTPDYKGMSDYFKNYLYMKNDDSYRCLYKHGFYHRVSNLRLENLIETLLGVRANPTSIRNFKAMITARCYKDKEEFVSPTGLINTKDCVVNINSKALAVNSPDFNFTYKLPYKYDAEAKCPEFIKFLNFIFENDQSLIDLIGEIIGYTLVGGEPFKHNAFCFYGDGRNGKSTLLDVIVAVLGNASVSSVPMGLIGKPFSAVRLDGKLANIVEESPKNIDAEVFKNIVGGGFVTAARKGIDEFDLKVNARMFFATNEFPHFKDTTAGLKERLVIIPFEKFIPEAERDHKLKGRLLKEIPGVLNFALDGWERFKKQDLQFTKSDHTKEAMKEYVLESDSVLRWLDENVKVTDDPADFIVNSDMYKRYSEDSKKDGFMPRARIPFIKKIKAKLGVKKMFRKEINMSEFDSASRIVVDVKRHLAVMPGVRFKAFKSDYEC